MVTPEERKASSIAHALTEGQHGVDSENDDEEIYFVRIPADTSEPLEELSFRCRRTDRSGDVLLDHLKHEFRVGTVDLNLLSTQSTTTSVLNNELLPSVSSDALQKVAAEAHVETFTLVHPVPSNNFISVRIYLDEAGMLKRLPLNSRATEFAKRAGFQDPAPIFYGNVFLGRLQMRAPQRNLSLRVGRDTSLDDAPWLKQALTDNLEYQMEQNRITGRNDQRQPLVDGQETSKVEENGRFSWTQTEAELEIKIPLPATTTSKSIKVNFKPQVLRVLVQTADDILLNLDLFERVDTDSCTWTLEKNTAVDATEETSKVLVVSMEKQEAALWPRIRD